MYRLELVLEFELTDNSAGMDSNWRLSKLVSAICSESNCIVVFKFLIKFKSAGWFLNSAETSLSVVQEVNTEDDAEDDAKDDGGWWYWRIHPITWRCSRKKVGMWQRRTAVLPSKTNSS